MKKRLRRNRMVLAGLFGLSLAAITLKGGAVSYGFFFLCLIVPFLSLCYLLYVYATFRIYQEAGSRTIVKGEPVPYRFALTNEQFLVYTDVQVAFYSDTSEIAQAPEETRYTLFPGESVRYETVLTGRFRGEFPAGIREVTVVDYLQLFRIRYRVPTEMRITVLPRVPVLEQPKHLTGLERLAESDSVFRREEPDIPVRDYRSGDALKHIHWKASAKSGTLKVRTQTGFDLLPVQLLVDLKPPAGGIPDAQREEFAGLQEEDTRLECALALAWYLARRRTPFVVRLPHGEKTVLRVSDESGFTAVYEQLSRAEFTPESMPAWDRLPAGVFCIRVMGEIREMWLQELLAAAEADTQMLIFSVSEKPSGVQTFAQHPGIRIFSVPRGAKPEDIM